MAENGSGRFSVIINPVELCDDGQWKVNNDYNDDNNRNIYDYDQL